MDYIIYINDINDDIVKKDIIFLYIYNSFISYGNYKTIIKNIIRGKWFIDFGCKDISCELSYYDEVIDNINDSFLETYNMKQFINKRIQSSVLSILEDKRTINVEIQHLDTYKIMYGRNVQDCYLCIIDVVIDGSLYANMKIDDFTQYLYKKVLFLKDYFRNIINDTNDEYLFTYYIFKVSLMHDKKHLLGSCFDDILYIFYCEEIDLITDDSLIKLKNNIENNYKNTLFYNKITKLLSTLEIE